MATPDIEYLILGGWGVWVGESWERKGYYFFHSNLSKMIRLHIFDTGGVLLSNDRVRNVYIPRG
jgi:hypothetical protein